MADAAIGATIQFVLETALSLANDRIDLVLGFKDELQRLSRTAKRIQGFVADADDKMHSPEVLDWLKDLEGEVFKAENVLDEVNYENLRREVKYRRSQLKRKVCFFFSFLSAIGFRSRMASKIRDINANLERINREANEVGLVFRFQQEAALSAVLAPAVATTRRQTDSVVVPNVVGRANDESEIVKMLLSPSDKVVSVIPIFGPPGMGKTTLAKSIYNNPQIAGHFAPKDERDNRIWVCVAKKITIVELFKIILESLSRQKVLLDNREAIVQDIKNELKGKRYLLVLDDVWNDEGELWSDFFTTLEGLNAAKGSWCLVTTRIRDVPNTMSRHLKIIVRPYELKKLTDDDCWSILEGKAIAAQEISEATKKQILNKCGGLPLAATLFGSLLLMNRKEEWPSIVQKGPVDGAQDVVEQILKVSFDHLSPASVKKCFAYCSMFPQDTELEKDLLIELWMAEGFLRPDPPKNERLMEDIGDDYLRILLQSSLLEEANEWWETYKMHDLVHDFAKSVLNQDRYLALNSSQGTTKDTIKKCTTSLRTLFLDSSISDDDLSMFECLHVLKLFGGDVKVLPDSIGKLIHLRFLDISDSQITKLPKSLCKLYKLQTMRIKDGKLEEGLPEQMSNLISLRHLHYYDTRADFQMPSEMGRLTHLQTLEFFNVGQEDGRGIEELESLKDLKGSLEIRNLQLVNGKKEAEKAKLFAKPYLYNLTLSWGSEDRESDNCDENVLEGLRPHQNLQKLEIRNFMGDHFPGWLINLSALVKLKLIDCKRCRELPTLGQLPSLERLELKGLENVSSIGVSFYGISSGGGQVRKFFPALKYLLLEVMGNLAEWKDEDEVRSTIGAAEVDLFPVLEELYIWGCFQLSSAPSHFPSIRNLHISGNCHVSLLKTIVSSIIDDEHITALSSLKLSGLTAPHCDEHIGGLDLRKRRHNNNLEEEVECDLELERCGSLRSEMLEHLCHLPSIRYLQLQNFSNLTRLMGQESFFTSVEQLKISYCDELTSLPGEMLESCASLQKLEISYCDGLTSLPGEMLESCASLRILQVSYCSNLVSFPLDLQKTPSLEILDLLNCPKLMIAYMPKGFAFLTGLRELKIGPFPINETTEFDWSGLISSSSSTLTSLEFFGSPHVESLPEQLQYLTSLTELLLEGFGIEALPDWIGNLVSLQRLRLWDCENLRDLPSMAARERLTNFESLIIFRCPLLKERWNPQSGTDSQWPMILDL